MNEPMVKLEELILAGLIRHGDNPLLSWAVANAVVKVNTTGLMCLDKASATERIDPLAALLNALKGAIDDPAYGPSVYDTRGAILI
jgi:phage terminase large subunit-like protein